MKIDTWVTGFGTALIVLLIIMVIGSFSFHGSGGFFNMSAHHDSITSGTGSSQTLTK
ncbi:MAG: hypothetical protein GXP13_07680 [Gammaproteobacteria bacterium]|nr:hypothetical protein [Gammaproteobacteria bacterium]